MILFPNLRFFGIFGKLEEAGFRHPPKIPNIMLKGYFLALKSLRERKVRKQRKSLADERPDSETENFRNLCKNLNER